LLEPVNLLILDEPTNHLDMRSKDILKEALRNYNGTMILVSHDREFLDGLCNKVYEFNNQRIREYPGGIFEFLQSRKLENLKELEKKVAETRKANTQNQSKSNSIDQPRASQQQNREQEKKQKQLQTRIRNAEERIALLEIEISELEKSLADPGIFSNQSKYNELLAQFNNRQQELNREMESWEGLMQEQ
jgi:ATP-binding cassette subfamily F protein 3